MGQGPSALAVGAGVGMGFLTCFSLVCYFFLLSGRPPDID